MLKFLQRLWNCIRRLIMDLTFIGINAFRKLEFGEYTYLLGSCFCTNDTNRIEESSQSILWFTYRTNFPAIGGDGPTSDQGWGCMLRCGQMLLAHALKVVHLGSNWQWTPGTNDAAYRRLLRMFQDKRSSLFSLQQIAQMGVNEGKQLCQWFGPNTIAQCLKKLAIYDGWSQLAIHVAMDNLLIESDVRLLAATPWSDNTEPEDEKRPKLEKDEREDKPWRPVLILVPLRLGLSAINREYLRPVQEFFKLPQCCGILGGRPNHAVFFTGFSGEELYYLDPHTTQPAVDLDRRRTTSPVHLHAPTAGDEEQSPEKEDVVLIEENGQESNGINGNFDIAWPVNEPETSQIMAKPVETYLADEVSNNLDQTNSKAPTDEEEFNDESFHCRDLLHMNFDSLDPSLALGFICKLEDDFNDLVEQLKKKVLTASRPAIFELLDVRPNYMAEYIPYTRAATTSGEATDKDYEDFADPQFDSEDEFEILH